MRVIYTIIVVLIMIFMITFSLENPSVIQLRYYDALKLSLPTYMLIFVSFLIGVVFVGFMGVVERFRMNRTINKLNKTIRELRREMRANEAPPIIEDKVSPRSSEPGS